MPILDPTPPSGDKPIPSNPSTPVLAGNDEWFEDAILRAAEKHALKLKAQAK